MPLTVEADQELSRALQQVIAMFQDRVTQVDLRLTLAETPIEACLIRMERAQWTLAVAYLLAAQRLQGG